MLTLGGAEAVPSPEGNPRRVEGEELKLRAVFSFENRELTARLPMATKNSPLFPLQSSGMEHMDAPCLQSPFHNYKQLRRPSQLIS